MIQPQEQLNQQQPMQPMGQQPEQQMPTMIMREEHRGLSASTIATIIIIIVAVLIAGGIITWLVISNVKNTTVIEAPQQNTGTVQNSTDATLPDISPNGSNPAENTNPISNIKTNPFE